MDIDERLANWKRYYRDRRIKDCLSVIGRLYHAPYRQWMSLHEIVIQVPVDIWDAALVEWCWKGMLGQSKTLLQRSYMWDRGSTHGFNGMLRKIGVKPYEYEMKLSRAKRIMQSRLDDCEKSGINGQNLNRFMRDVSLIRADFVRPKETAEDFY